VKKKWLGTLVNASSANNRRHFKEPSL